MNQQRSFLMSTLKKSLDIRSLRSYIVVPFFLGFVDGNAEMLYVCGLSGV